MSQYPGQPQQPPYSPYPPTTGPIGFIPQPQPQQNIQMNPPGPPVSAQLGDTPIRMVCPNCRNEILTQTSTECSLVQHAAFFIMCITGICLICSCLPYCMDSLATTRHQCPRCHAHLGSSR